MPSLLATLLLPTTWIVDAAFGPGAHYIDLPPAIAAAQNGDTIVVRSGNYSAFTVAGKALTIRGVGVLPVVQSGTIASVPSGQFVLISRIAFQPGAGTALSISGPGDVALVECTARGALLSHGLVVSGASVHAQHCWFDGGRTTFLASSSAAGDGAQVVNGARLSGFECYFRGGHTFTGHGQGNLYAGRGLVTAGEVNLANCYCYGGDSAYTAGPIPHGGDGVLSINGVLRAHGQTTLFRGGVAVPGAGPSVALSGVALRNYGAIARLHFGCTLQPAMTGAPTISGPAITGLPHLTRLLVSGNLLPTGETSALLPVTVTFDGVFPNAPYLFLVGFQPDFVASLPMTLGEQLVAASASSITYGLLDSAARFSFTFTPAVLMPGFLGVPLFAQAGSFDAAALQVRMSNAEVRLFAL